MDATRTRNEVLRVYERFNEHDWGVIDEIAAEDYVDRNRSMLGPGTDAAATRRRLEDLAGAFPDLAFEVLDVVADAGKAMARVHVTGTHQHPFAGIDATGRRIDWELVDVVAYNERGELTEHWTYADRLDLLQQLGATPAGPAPTGA